MLMAMPMVIVMTRAVVGMLGVMRCLRNLIGIPVVDGPCLFTSRCLRNLMGMLVVACLCLFNFDYIVLATFSAWLRTRHVGLLAGDTTLRTSRDRRKRNCYCQSGSQNLVHGLSPCLK